MLELIAQNLAPIMFTVIMIGLLMGYPLCFTLATGGIGFVALGVLFSRVAPEHVHLTWSLMQAQPDRIFGILSNETLLAVPFFTMMGAIFQRSGIAEDLLGSVAHLFGPMRGGLSITVISVGALMAATTGVVSASVITMGLIALPIMMRSGYHPHVAAGTITAAGTLSQIVPPSLVLIVMADQVRIPVSDMYAAALVPSMLMIALYYVLIIALALLVPRLMPAMEGACVKARDYTSLIAVSGLSVFSAWAASPLLDGRLSESGTLIAVPTVGALTALLLGVLDRRRGWISTELSRRLIFSAIPTLGLIFLVLGTVFLGIATPTESGSLGAVGALALALWRRNLPFDTLRHVLEQTAKLTVFVYFIMIGASVFSLSFYSLGGDEWMHRILLTVPGEQTGFVLFTMILIFILGCFLDFFEIALIVVPMLLPTAAALEIDPLWFGMLISLNLQISFLTPPFGFALFYLRAVAPLPGAARHGVSTLAIYTGAAPFVLLNIIVIGVVMAYPAMIKPMVAETIAGGTLEIRRLPEIGRGGAANLNDLFK